MTLNLSRSVKAALLALIANFFASEVASHFAFKSNVFNALLLNMINDGGIDYTRVPVLLPLRTLGTIMPVGVSLLRG
jgi:hypothetical protein